MLDSLAYVALVEFCAIAFMCKIGCSIFLIRLWDRAFGGNRKNEVRRDYSHPRCHEGDDNSVYTCSTQIIIRNVGYNDDYSTVVIIKNVIK